jgi:uncharacterized membrane protein (UPF0127 family)
MPDMHFYIDILIRSAASCTSRRTSRRTTRGRCTGRLARRPVLELPAGTAQRRGFRVGDAVQVDGLGP